MQIKLHDSVLTISDNFPKTNDTVEDFKAASIAAPFGPAENVLEQFKGRKKIITSFPSIDTGTCALQVKHFNQEASQRNLPVITISNDLPFALARGCEAFKANQVVLYSDYLLNDFAKKFHLQLEQVPLLARSVYVLDENNVVLYYEISTVLSAELDYDKALTYI